MNAITISLIVICLLLAVLSGILFIKNLVLTHRIKLYGEFTRRTDVKKFLSILERTDKRVLDSEISLMLDKYFELVLTKLEYKWIPNLLADLKKSKHSKVLYESFSRAASKKSYGLFARALTANVENVENKSAIQSFLDTFPEEQKKKEYKIALRYLTDDYNKGIIDYPYEYRQPVEEAMKEFKARVVL